jgi:hypothetical protein
MTIAKVVFGIFILYYLVYFLTPNVKMATEQRQQIDSLNVLVKQLHEDNLKLEEEIDNSIDKIKGQKTIVKEIYHEKINSVDKLTVRELDSFFTDRYKY